MQGYAAGAMPDRALDLAAIDAYLDRFDDDDDESPTPFPARRTAPVLLPGDHADEQFDEQFEGRFASEEELRWGRGDAVDDPLTDKESAPPTRRQSRRWQPRLTTRPADLPPLDIPPGYRRDRRGTWRYLDGRPVPGARDVTLETLWPFPVTDPLVIPDDAVRTCPELFWCARVGERGVAAQPAGRGERVHVTVWRVPAEEWEDRARWPLTLDAPELAPSRLWGVADIARVCEVTPSTVTAYLSRGLLPAPQTRIGGRPAWSVPIILTWLRSRPG